uniref:Uncharacterized protein n=1 Tax=Zea mays TaxID=4577 RepID=B4FRM1_MAIZE|nr:unknown [Zea mays]ACN27930.1 unknown [Zea mays]
MRPRPPRVHDRSRQAAARQKPLPHVPHRAHHADDHVRQPDVRRRRHHATGSRLRPGHPLRPPPRRGAPHRPPRPRGLHDALHTAPRDARQGGRLRHVVPGRRGRGGLLLHHPVRRRARARAAGVRLHAVRRVDGRAHAAVTGAGRGGVRGLRGDGRNGRSARDAAGAGSSHAVSADEEGPELRVAGVPRQALHGGRRGHREHGGRAGAVHPRGHRRRPLRAKTPRSGRLPDRPGPASQAAVRARRRRAGSSTAARVREVARRAAPSVRRAALLWEHGRQLPVAPGPRDRRRPRAQRAPLPVGAPWPATAGRFQVPDGRQRPRAAPGRVPGEDEGPRPRVAHVGAAEGHPRQPRRRRLRHPLRLELHPREPVARRADGALAAVRGAAPERVRARGRHGRRRRHAGGQEARQLRRGGGAGARGPVPDGRVGGEGEEGAGEGHGGEGPEPERRGQRRVVGRVGAETGARDFAQARRQGVCHRKRGEHGQRRRSRISGQNNMIPRTRRNRRRPRINRRPPCDPSGTAHVVWHCSQSPCAL